MGSRQVFNAAARHALSLAGPRLPRLVWPEGSVISKSWADVERGGGIVPGEHRRDGVNEPALADILGPGLSVVFVGTAVGTASAERGHYYAGRGNRFWQLLHEAKLTPRLLAPEEDASLFDFGIGITDLVKGVAQSHDRGLDFSGAAGVAAHLVAACPRWVAFNGLTAGREAARILRYGGSVALGEQPWTLGTSRVFVLPNSSGAYASMPYAEKLRWWTALAALVAV